METVSYSYLIFQSAANIGKSMDDDKLENIFLNLQNASDKLFDSLKPSIENNPININISPEENEILKKYTLEELQHEIKKCEDEIHRRENKIRSE